MSHGSESDPKHPAGHRTGAAGRALSRRASLRPEVRAAMALEEAGDLPEAARVFEYAREHAQAALIRLEIAKTVSSLEARVDVLREGCARNPGQTPESRTLHAALAEALLQQAEQAPSSARRRALETEAAQALEEADEGARAGEIYESLGLLHRARDAYLQSGEISRLELVLEVLDRVEQRAAALQTLEREIDDAIAQGRRRYAHLLLVEHVRGTRGGGALPFEEPHLADRRATPQLVSRLLDLEARLVTRPRLDLRWDPGPHVTSLRADPEFVIGRAPHVHLSLPDPQLSREHASLRLNVATVPATLVLADLGSKSGSFWEGDPVEPDLPVSIVAPGELGLGVTASVEIHPLRGTTGSPLSAFVRASASDRWMYYCPGGGPLWLTPEIRVPTAILFDRGYAILDFAPGVETVLNGVALGRDASIDLLVGDRIAVVDTPLVMEVVG